MKKLSLSLRSVLILSLFGVSLTLSAVAGALVGDLVGSHFGQGCGKTAATIASVTGGALIGNSLGCQ